MNPRASKQLCLFSSPCFLEEVLKLSVHWTPECGELGGQAGVGVPVSQRHRPYQGAGSLRQDPRQLSWPDSLHGVRSQLVVLGRGETGAWGEGEGGGLPGLPRFCILS